MHIVLLALEIVYGSSKLQALNEVQLVTKFLLCGPQIFERDIEQHFFCKILGQF